MNNAQEYLLSNALRDAEISKRNADESVYVSDAMMDFNSIKNGELEKEIAELQMSLKMATIEIKHSTKLINHLKCNTVPIRKLEEIISSINQRSGRVKGE